MESVCTGNPRTVGSNPTLSAPLNEAVDSRTRSSEMKKLISFVFIGLLPLFMIRGEASDTTPLAERMDELGVPGVSVAVIDDGKIAWARGWGLADVASGRPVTIELLPESATSFFVRLDGRPVAFEFEGDDVVIVAAGRRGQKVGG